MRFAFKSDGENGSGAVIGDPMGMGTGSAIGWGSDSGLGMRAAISDYR